MPDEIVPQRCVVVLPSTGEFDSRTYRIARTLHERGHQVTVLARWKPGLAREEIHPVGYPILRVEATAIDGLPFPSVTLPILRTLRLAARPILGPPAAPSGPPTATGSAGASSGVAPADTDTSGDETDPGWAHPTARDPGRLRGYVRRARIFLMIRSHRRRGLAVSPPADVYHGMAYMGISVALRSAAGIGPRSSTTRATSTWSPRTSLGCAARSSRSWPGWSEAGRAPPIGCSPSTGPTPRSWRGGSAWRCRRSS